MCRTLADLAAGLASLDEPERIDAVVVFCAMAVSDSQPDVAALARPPSTGDPQWDALLGGVAEYVCGVKGLRLPGWSEHNDRFLEVPWAVGGHVDGPVPWAFDRRRVIFSPSIRLTAQDA